MPWVETNGARAPDQRRTLSTADDGRLHAESRRSRLIAAGSALAVAGVALAGTAAVRRPGSPATAKSTADAASFVQASTRRHPPVTLKLLRPQQAVLASPARQVQAIEAGQAAAQVAAAQQAAAARARAAAAARAAAKAAAARPRAAQAAAAPQAQSGAAATTIGGPAWLAQPQGSPQQIAEGMLGSVPLVVLGSFSCSQLSWNAESRLERVGDQPVLGGLHRDPAGAARVRYGSRGPGLPDQRRPPRSAGACSTSSRCTACRVALGRTSSRPDGWHQRLVLAAETSGKQVAAGRQPAAAAPGDSRRRPLP